MTGPVDFLLCETEQAMTSGVYDESGRVWVCASCGTRKVFVDFEEDEP